MVNVKNLFGMAVMATALVGCASNDEVNNPNAEQPTNGVSYASFKINLPTTSGTRAPGNPVFDGGEASEYAVDNATVLVFKKDPTSTEDEYTFVTSASIGNMAPWNKDNTAGNGVTTEARVTAELSGLNQTDITAKNYYALILLNNDLDTSNKKVKMPASGDTYKKWNFEDFESKVNAGKYASSENGIFMANAPQYNTSGEPTTLVKIEGIYNTKEAANSHEGTTVHVERGLSKVTVKAGTKDITGGVYDGAKVAINNWTLDVLNKKTYAVHVTTGLNSGTTNFADIWSTDRFYDTSTGTTFKRVYWGMDPNYSNLTGKTSPSDYASDFSTMDGAAKFTEAPFVSPVNVVLPTGGVDAKFVNSEESMYCLENTFNIFNMTQGQTTRVVFKATYTPKGYETETNSAAKHNNDLLHSTKAGTFFMLGDNPQTWTPIALTEQITTYTVEAYNAANPTAKIDASKVSVNLTGITIDNTGKVDFSSIGIQANSADLDATVSSTVSDKLGKIIAYTCGTSYYIARIKHFDETTQTPWNAGDPTYGDNTNNVKYLGRYGMLRNNWYYLTVDKVSNPGSPTVPTIKPDSPDDENNYYISVSVKILDWAKRTQKVDL